VLKSSVVACGSPTPCCSYGRAITDINRLESDIPFANVSWTNTKAKSRTLSHLWSVPYRNLEARNICSVCSVCSVCCKAAPSSCRCGSRPGPQPQGQDDHTCDGQGNVYFDHDYGNRNIDGSDLSERLSWQPVEELQACLIYSHSNAAAALVSCPAIRTFTQALHTDFRGKEGQHL
jgi:hypothetical protein